MTEKCPKCKGIMIKKKEILYPNYEEIFECKFCKLLVRKTMTGIEVVYL